LRNNDLRPEYGARAGAILSQADFAEWGEAQFVPQSLNQTGEPLIV
jgi:hypothetical protein